jgi:hypothetical protein
MVIKRSSNCPLCGAKLTAIALLDACTEIIDWRLGVLEAHCPYCQGYLEVMPAAGRADIGYMVGTNHERFDLAHSLPCEGLEVERATDTNCLTLKAPGRSWRFSE